MKMKSKATQHLLTIGLLFGLAFLGMLEPAMAERNPKIHVLFVWGTNATDTRQNCLQSRETFENCMADMGIRSGGKYIASFTSLSGDDAHPKKILEHCQRMAQEAGPDDALFVYILSHGCCVYPKNAPETKENLINVLSPAAADGAHMNLREVSIKRSSIIKAMKSGSHRLNVLITDSSSCIFASSSNGAESLSFNYNDRSIDSVLELCSQYDDDSSSDSVNSLMSILLNCRGTINWNSTSPFGGHSQTGEIAIGNNEGTLFTQAFIKVAGKRMKSSSQPSVDAFFNQLGSSLFDTFKEAKRNARNTAGFIIFIDQSQQTLTVFDDNGCVKREWSEKDWFEEEQNEADDDGIMY